MNKFKIFSKIFSKYLFVGTLLLVLIAGFNPSNTDLLRKGTSLVNGQDTLIFGETQEYTPYDNSEPSIDTSVNNYVDYQDVSVSGPLVFSEPASYVAYDNSQSVDFSSGVYYTPYTGLSSDPLVFSQPAAYTPYSPSSDPLIFTEPVSYTPYSYDPLIFTEPTGHTPYSPVPSYDTSRVVFNPGGYEPLSQNVVYNPPTYQPITYDQPAPAPTYEGPGCVGNHSVWAIWTGSDFNTAITVERDYGVVPGECNNPYLSNVPSFAREPIVQPVVQQMPASNYPSNQYTYVTNNISSYSSSSAQATAVANPSQTQSQNIYLTPANVYAQPSPQPTNYPQGGSYQALLNPCPVGSYPVGSPRQYTCVDPNQPSPQPQPVSGVYQYQQGLNPCPVGMYPVGNPSSYSCVDPNLPTNQPQTSTPVYGTSGYVAPTVAPVADGTYQQPQVMQTSGAAQPNQATTSAQPKVTGSADTKAKELPRTGLPLAGILLSGLLPVGLKLRKFGIKDNEISPNSIWMERELGKN